MVCSEVSAAPEKNTNRKRDTTQFLVQGCKLNMLAKIEQYCSWYIFRLIALLQRNENLTGKMSDSRCELNYLYSSGETECTHVTFRLVNEQPVL